jgi:hypothetical protein
MWRVEDVVGHPKVVIRRHESDARPGPALACGMGEYQQPNVLSRPLVTAAWKEEKMGFSAGRHERTLSRR